MMNFCKACGSQEVHGFCAECFERETFWGDELTDEDLGQRKDLGQRWDNAHKGCSDHYCDCCNPAPRKTLPLKEGVGVIHEPTCNTCVIVAQVEREMADEARYEVKMVIEQAIR